MLPEAAAEPDAPAEAWVSSVRDCSSDILGGVLVDSEWLEGTRNGE